MVDGSAVRLQKLTEKVVLILKGGETTSEGKLCVYASCMDQHPEEARKPIEIGREGGRP